MWILWFNIFYRTYKFIIEKTNQNYTIKNTFGSGRLVDRTQSCEDCNPGSTPGRAKYRKKLIYKLPVPLRLR